MKKYVRMILQTIFIVTLTLSLIPKQLQSVSAQDTEQTSLPVSFQVIQSNSNGIEILLSSPSYQAGKIDINGETFDRIIAPNTVSNATPGQYQLPIATSLIGVPPEAKISIEIIQDTTQEIPGTYQIPRAPFPAHTDELDTTQQWDYADYGLEIQKEEPVIPGTTHSVKVADDAWIRDQRVIQLEYSPFEYRTGSGKLVWHSQVQVRVHFDFPVGVDNINSATPENQLKSSPFEEMLETSLLNYEQAQAWRSKESLSSLNTPNTPQASIPGLGDRYRIGITEDGIYTLGYDVLKAANPIIDSIDPRKLQMSSQGKNVAIRIIGEGDGSFDPGDYIVFYGQRFYGDYLASLHQNENQNWYVYPRQLTDGNYVLWQPEFNALMLEKYTYENVYWLSEGTANGLRMATVNGDPSGNGNSPVPYYRETVRAEESTLWSTIRFAGEESWFWEKIDTANTPFDYQITAPNPSDQGPNAIIRAEFVSGSNFSSVEQASHRTKVSFNSVAYDTFNWSGKSRYSYNHEVTPASIQNGINTFEIEALPLYDYDSNELPVSIYIDWFAVEYNREFVAQNNAIQFKSSETSLQKYQVSGFTNTSNMRILDITNPYVPLQVLNPQVTASDVTISLTSDNPSVAMQGGGKSVSQGQVSYYEPPEWSTMSAGADYVFITHADFLSGAQNLAAYRASTGLSTKVFDVQDLYNEFFYGIYNPIAIKYFLAYTFANWQTAPTYALLIGDGHFNFHDYNLDKYGATNQFMPPYLAWVDPWQGEVDSTNLLATVVGSDVLPDLFIARLPVNTNAEVNNYLSKLTAYDGAAYSGGWEQNHIFIAQNPDAAGDFEQFADDVITTYVDPYSYASPVRLYQTDYGCYSSGSQECIDLNQDIKSNINGEGSLLISYIGHASVGYWSHDRIFTLDDIPDLNNSGQLPVILSMTCLDGYWDFTSNYIGSALAEELVRSDNAGAIATFSPTGLGVSSGHDVLHEGFYDSLMVDGNWEMGSAAYQGKLWLYQSGTHYDLINTYTIYGDPALKIKEPFSFSGSPASNEIITHSPGSIQTHTITIQNTGSAPDTYLVEATYSWNTSVTNITSEVPPGGSVDIPVEVTTPMEYGVSDTATVTIKSRGDRSEVFTSQLVTSIPFDYGYEVSPLESSKLVLPNTSVDHSFTLTNTGNEINAYSLNISGNSWPTNISMSSTGNLASGEVIQFTVTVDSPDAKGVSDSALLSIESLNGIPLLTEIPITTRVPQDYEFSISPEEDSLSVSAGTVATYILTIQNTGLQPDSYQIAISGNAWGTTSSIYTTEQLSWEESTQVLIYVTTPNQGNLSDTATVTISSDAVSGSVKEATLTTSTRLVEVYLPLVIR